MKKGFTLMELLIVIALIGILVTMGVASYSTAQIKARDARRRGDMKIIQSAYEQYHLNTSSTYPTATSQVTTIYLPGGHPTDPKPAPYTQYSFAFDSDGAPYYYCACTLLETVGAGNSSNATCTFSGTLNYFCVRNLQ